MTTAYQMQQKHLPGCLTWHSNRVVCTTSKNWASLGRLATSFCRGLPHESKGSLWSLWRLALDGKPLGGVEVPALEVQASEAFGDVIAIVRWMFQSKMRWDEMLMNTSGWQVVKLNPKNYIVERFKFVSFISALGAPESIENIFFGSMTLMVI